MKLYHPFSLALLLLSGWAASSWGQAVVVTAQLDDPTLLAGESTTLRVSAQVAIPLESEADRIFSWYVDLLNTNGAVATANYGAMVKAASDNDPDLSANGFDDGPNRRAVFDTFTELPGAGVGSPVELLAIPVTALSAGQTRFLVQTGSGGDPLEEDFQVAPLAGGDAWTGGDYSAAFADLTVFEPCSLELQIRRINGGGPGQELELSFTPCPGFTHYLESKDSLTGGVWEVLPDGPHDLGTVLVTNDVVHRFFRVRVELP